MPIHPSGVTSGIGGRMKIDFVKKTLDSFPDHVKVVLDLVDEKLERELDDLELHKLAIRMSNALKKDIRQPIGRKGPRDPNCRPPDDPEFLKFAQEFVKSMTRQRVLKSGHPELPGM